MQSTLHPNIPTPQNQSFFGRLRYVIYLMTIRITSYICSSELYLLRYMHVFVVLFGELFVSLFIIPSITSGNTTILLSILTILLSLTELYVYGSLIMGKIDVISKGKKINLNTIEGQEAITYMTIRTRECPCGHIPQSKNAVHCTLCNHCVEELDHHCIYLGKCIIGQNKYKYQLLLFVTSVMLLLNSFTLVKYHIPYLKRQYTPLYEFLLDNKECTLLCKIYILVIELGSKEMVYFTTLFIGSLLSVVITIMFLFNLITLFKNKTTYQIRKDIKKSKNKQQ